MKVMALMKFIHVYTLNLGLAKFFIFEKGRKAGAWGRSKEQRSWLLVLGGVQHKRA